MTRFNFPGPINASLSVMAMMAIILSGCSNHDKATVMPPAKVKIAVVSGQSFSEGGSYSGTVDSDESSTVSFSVPGTITKLYVQTGEKVSKGQLLARVKSESLVNASNIAQAELEEAQDAYRRLKKLHDANALPDIKWVEVQSKLKQAENAAALSSRAVGDAALYSPINGYIAEKFSDEGQTVIAAQPIFKVVNLEDMTVAISVPEEDISSFDKGCTAMVTFDALDSLKITGKLNQKGVVADPFTRSYTVKFSIPNPGGKVLPGMIANVTPDCETPSDTVVSSVSFELPSQAVLLGADNRQFVWVVKNGKAMRKFVTANEFSSSGVTVKSGLQRGDSVIVAGMQKVSTGTEVSIAE